MICHSYGYYFLSVRPGCGYDTLQRSHPEHRAVRLFRVVSARSTPSLWSHSVPQFAKSAAWSVAGGLMGDAPENPDGNGGSHPGGNLRGFSMCGGTTIFGVTFLHGKSHGFDSWWNNMNIHGGLVDFMDGPAKEFRMDDLEWFRGTHILIEHLRIWPP